MQILHKSNIRIFGERIEYFIFEAIIELRGHMGDLLFTTKISFIMKLSHS